MLVCVFASWAVFAVAALVRPLVAVGCVTCMFASGIARPHSVWFVLALFDCMMPPPSRLCEPLWCARDRVRVHWSSCVSLCGAGTALTLRGASSTFVAGPLSPSPLRWGCSLRARFGRTLVWLSSVRRGDRCVLCP